MTDQFFVKPQGSIQVKNGVYTGPVSDSGLPHGVGKCVYNTGNVYIGDWENGIKSGSGRFFYHSGDKYEGSFDNDHMTGTGTFTFSSSDIYQGQFVNGKFHGEGEMYFHSSGDRWKGNWNNDQMFGDGVWTFSGHSKKYRGVMKEGKFFRKEGDSPTNGGDSRMNTWGGQSQQPLSEQKRKRVMEEPILPFLAPLLLEEKSKSPDEFDNLEISVDTNLGSESKSKSKESTPLSFDEIMQDGAAEAAAEVATFPVPITLPSRSIPIVRKVRSSSEKVIETNTPPMNQVGNLLFFSPEESAKAARNVFPENAGKKGGGKERFFEDRPVQNAPLSDPEFVKNTPNGDFSEGDLVDLLNSRDITISKIKKSSKEEANTPVKEPGMESNGNGSKELSPQEELDKRLSVGPEEATGVGKEMNLTELLASPDVTVVPSAKNTPSVMDPLLDENIPVVVTKTPSPPKTPPRETQAKETGVCEGQLVVFPKTPRDENGEKIKPSILTTSSPPNGGSREKKLPAIKKDGKKTGKNTEISVDLFGAKATKIRSKHVRTESVDSYDFEDEVESSLFEDLENLGNRKEQLGQLEEKYRKKIKQYKKYQEKLQKYESRMEMISKILGNSDENEGKRTKM